MDAWRGDCRFESCVRMELLGECEVRNPHLSDLRLPGPIPRFQVRYLYIWLAAAAYVGFARVRGIALELNLHTGVKQVKSNFRMVFLSINPMQ